MLHFSCPQCKRQYKVEALEMLALYEGLVTCYICGKKMILTNEDEFSNLAKRNIAKLMVDGWLTNIGEQGTRSLIERHKYLPFMKQCLQILSERGII